MTGVQTCALPISPHSLAPFLLSFGLFPSFATLALPEAALAAPWATAAGAALGAAVHLTNVVRDLDDDRRTGVRGLPHRLGARTSVIVAAVGIVVGAVAVLVGSGPVGVSAVGVVFFAAVALVAAATVVVALVRPPGRTVFRLTMLAALLLAAQLVAT